MAYTKEKAAAWQRAYRKRTNHVKKMNLKKYGLSFALWCRLMIDQMNTCAACGGREVGDNQYGRMSLAVDHDHSTVEVRGLLCHRCNRALGLLGDSAERVQAVADYRRKFG